MHIFATNTSFMTVHQPNIPHCFHLLTECRKHQTQDIKASLIRLSRLNLLEVETGKQSFALATAVRHTRETELKKLPHTINVITSAARGRLKETAHCRILADLLRKKELQRSFLDYFLGNFDLKGTGSIPPTDTDRIDICIEGKNFFVIIESKVNGAEEQPGQIYRYVQIAYSKGYRPEEIYVLYLCRMFPSRPSNYSLTENGKGKTSVKADLADRLVCLSYRNDILPWLETLPATDISENECYIQSALIQYIDYLRNLCETYDKYLPMKQAIEELLVQELKLNESQTSEERMQRIDDAIEDAEKLAEYLRELKTQEEWKKLEDDYQHEFPQLKIDNESGKNIGFYFTYKKELMSCCLTTDNKGPYWGIYHTEGNAPKNTETYFHKLVPTLKPDTPSDYWPFWGYTNDLESGLYALRILTQAIINDAQHEGSPLSLTV